MKINRSSFEGIDHESLETHCRIDKYDKFVLTDAIRLAYDVAVKPVSGWRLRRYKDDEYACPALQASVGKSQLFDVFMDLLLLLPPPLVFILQDQHSGEREYWLDAVDPLILQSTLLDYEDLLMNDGYTGVCILSRSAELELQFDVHKLLFVYGEAWQPFAAVLSRYKIERNDAMQLLTDAEHIHMSADRYMAQSETLRQRLGIDEIWT